jgi:hypothetical protein
LPGEPAPHLTAHLSRAPYAPAASLRGRARWLPTRAALAIPQQSARPAPRCNHITGVEMPSIRTILVTAVIAFAVYVLVNRVDALKRVATGA